MDNFEENKKQDDMQETNLQVENLQDDTAQAENLQDNEVQDAASQEDNTSLEKEKRKRGRSILLSGPYMRSFLSLCIYLFTLSG